MSPPKKKSIFFFNTKNQLHRRFPSHGGLDWLWVSGLKIIFGYDLAPGWPFEIIGNFFEFPLKTGRAKKKYKNFFFLKSKTKLK